MSESQKNNQESVSKEENKEIDEISGVETTGHEWDGLKELNNPLPRWWVWVFLVTCLWSVWYWVIYPAWPTPSGATQGARGYTQFKELEKKQSEIIARQKNYLERFEQASNQDVLNDPELYAFAIAGGAAAFKDNCATCHGTGAQGGHGYPNLNDDDWLWGGTLEDIHQTITYG
ncbi:MAG: cytochrome-c oxidase, cbb3-type subunit III, partial [Phototrophicales bacterium]